MVAAVMVRLQLQCCSVGNATSREMFGERTQQLGIAKTLSLRDHLYGWPHAVCDKSLESRWKLALSNFNGPRLKNNLARNAKTSKFAPS